MVNEWIQTSRYVYNKTVDAINKGSPVDEFKLRDQFVTSKTKKTHPKYQELTSEIDNLKRLRNKKKTDKEKLKCQEEIDAKKIELRNIAKSLPAEENDTINEWELNTHKDIRTGAIKDVCSAFKGCFTRLKKGQINHFEMGFRRKSNPKQTILLPKSVVKKNQNGIRIPALKMNVKIQVGKRSWKELQTIEIENDCRLVFDKNEYFMMVPRKKKITEERKADSYCGIDMGIRTFATMYGSNGLTEIDYDGNQLDKINKKLDNIRSKRIRPLKLNQRLRTRRRHLNKLERRKEHLVDELHWKSINMILNKNHLVFYGDIKSHDIVKSGENRWLNRRFQDLKLYKYKQRLEEKCIERNRMFTAVNECYTTKTCSMCGTMNDPGKSKVYHSMKCKRKIGRDVNAAKNILMKGILCSI